MKIYILLHHEIMGTIANYHADEMVFYTFSTLEKAIKAIKNAHVMPWSWWEIQRQELDKDDDWPVHVGYYGRKGGKLKYQPLRKCSLAFEQAVTSRLKESL